MKKAIVFVLLTLALSTSSFACPFHHIKSAVVTVGKDAGKVVKTVAVDAYKMGKYLIT